LPDLAKQVKDLEAELDELKKAIKQGALP
jgi:hypothetical protein